MTLQVKIATLAATPNVGRLKWVAQDLAGGNYSGIRELQPGWLLCNGVVIPNSGVYTALYTMVGTKFGAAGTLPTILDGRVPIPKGSGTALGSTGGEINHILSYGEMPSHMHYYADQDDAYGGGWDIDPWSPDHSQSGDITSTDFVGGGSAHNNMPPYLVVGCMLVKY